MKVNEYGNLANCTIQEFEAIKKILSEIGVQTRITTYHGDTQTCDIQFRNTYRDNCILYDASNAIEAAKRDMSRPW